MLNVQSFFKQTFLPIFENTESTEDSVNFFLKYKNLHGILVSSWHYLDCVETAKSIHLAEDIPGHAGLRKLKDDVTLSLKNRSHESFNFFRCGLPLTIKLLLSTAAIFGLHCLQNSLSKSAITLKSFIEADVVIFCLFCHLSGEASPEVTESKSRSNLRSLFS